jgi:protein-L-isoaspartate O-methyltransferase
MFSYIPEGDGRQGYKQGAPYDAIHVGAAAPVLPEAVRVSQIIHVNTLKK